ncbi:hypothetical protein [Ectobacillus sp. sgz5001026]|uniref:hypothetical protein n=1 Tax=Ectobacillus sp. sgz5001026 TaxID=3242473 RepID=UPI0036D35DCA
MESEGISDLVMIFIGASLVILGVLNMFSDVPPEFILGATLSGLFFTFSDPSIFPQRFIGNVGRRFLSSFMTMIAVFCFFLLPVVLLSNRPLFEMVAPIDDFATFVALGAVIIVFGLKSRKTNRERIAFLRTQRDQALESSNLFQQILEKKVEIAKQQEIIKQQIESIELMKQVSD